jgi:hypothetical protein
MNSKKVTRDEILSAQQPEEIFGLLDGTDRPGVVREPLIIMRFTNLVIQCAEIHDSLCLDRAKHSDEVVRKLWSLEMLAVKKIRSNVYGDTQATPRDL